MRPAIVALSVLLAAQIVLAAGVWWLSGSAGALPPQARLLAAKAEAIQTLTITAAEDSTVVLERSDAGWRLPQAGGFPADAQRVEQIIAVLSAPLRGFPLARSQAARERLAVAAQQYRRRLEFAGENGTLATVYLGNSAGTGEVYARAAGTQAVYKLGLGLSQASGELEDWYQPGAATDNSEDAAASASKTSAATSPSSERPGSEG